ncbi:hypothetical protein B0H14DRAFT_2562320 [Mycena olivaceomarginata]|nr:hypothetical protein B0H14DRAFT_2562320 [Mycena olivaceomarginata]
MYWIGEVRGAGHFGFRLRVSVIVHRSRGPQFGAKEKAIVREAAWKCGQRQWITDKAHNAHENRNDRETKSGGGTKALRKTSQQPFKNGERHIQIPFWENQS